MGTSGSVVDGIGESPADFVDAWAAHERQAARLALAACRLEASGAWAAGGSVSMAAWLRHHCRMSNRDATALVHRGRFLDRFPAIAEAACDHVLSAGQTQALQSKVDAAVEPILHRQQAELVSIFAPLSVADTATAAKAWRQRAEALVDLPEPSEPDRRLRFSRAGDGALVGNFVLDDGCALEFEQAIRIAMTWDGTAETRSTDRRHADALFDVCAFFNANHTKPGTPRRRPHVELISEQSDSESPTAWTPDHEPIGSSTADAFICDCVLHRVARSGSAVLSYGRATRTVPLDLFRSVAARDGGCRFPGCDRKVSWCDAHHIRFWRNMGRTDLDNLVLLCSRHHHLIHRPGWHLKLLPDGELDVTMPDGSPRTSQPRGRTARSP